MALLKYIKQIILFILFISSVCVFSQNAINGIVCDSDNHILRDTNIVLYLNDSIVAYTVSHEYGFSLDNSQNLLIRQMYSVLQ